LTYKVSTVLKQHFVIRKSMAKLTVGSLTLNRKKLSVKIGKREMMLSKPEFELLFFFAQNPGKQISIENLLQTIWGSEIYLVELSIEAYIQNLRKKIGHHIIEQTIDSHFYLSLT
jgi:two-component system, OmpR family, alkaline phosphatase synthesis response regulator PhoP